LIIDSTLTTTALDKHETLIIPELAMKESITNTMFIFEKEDQEGLILKSLIETLNVTGLQQYIADNMQINLANVLWQVTIMLSSFDLFISSLLIIGSYSS